MKNHEEFRNAVFEKAEKYKARQKARNKKIAEISCLCSLAFVITISAYLGLFPSLDQPMPEHTEESTSSSITTETTVSTTTTTTASFDRDSSVTVTPTETTTSTTVENTTTIETTTEQTVTETTSGSESQSIQMPIISKLEFRGTAKDSDFPVGKTELLEIVSYTQWLDFLEENTDDYPSLEATGILSDSFDEAYFEENALIIVQYAGYDIIAFGSDLPMDPSVKDEKYTFYINLRENKSNPRKQIHIVSVDKDTYKDAKIRVWETPENE
ncbi:MAG: hypothetical protein IJ489_11000 [Clostridia bacterium]|nr:hypothetical protein [Clostridia bacterium]